MNPPSGTQALCCGDQSPPPSKAAAQGHVAWATWLSGARLLSTGKNKEQFWWKPLQRNSVEKSTEVMMFQKEARNQTVLQQWQFVALLICCLLNHFLHDNLLSCCLLHAGLHNRATQGLVMHESQQEWKYLGKWSEKLVHLFAQYLQTSLLQSYSL